LIERFIVDFYCHARAVIVEVDGEVHDEQTEYDAERDAVLLAKGLRVLRVSNRRVMGAVESVVAEIEAFCRA
jgi:very-short-patch-repair endonuclease